VWIDTEPHTICGRLKGSFLQDGIKSPRLFKKVNVGSYITRYQSSELFKAFYTLVTHWKWWLTMWQVYQEETKLLQLTPYLHFTRGRPVQLNFNFFWKNSAMLQLMHKDYRYLYTNIHYCKIFIQRHSYIWANWSRVKK